MLKIEGNIYFLCRVCDPRSAKMIIEILLLWIVYKKQLANKQPTGLDILWTGLLIRVCFFNMAYVIIMIYSEQFVDYVPTCIPGEQLCWNLIWQHPILMYVTRCVCAEYRWM